MNLRLTDKKEKQFSLQQRYFLRVVASALAPMCTGVAVGCSGYLMLAVVLCFQHALLIWEQCPQALPSSPLKGLWIEAFSHLGCALYFTIWSIRNHIRNLVSLLCFTSSFTLHGQQTDGQALTEWSTDQHKLITPALTIRNKAFWQVCHSSALPEFKNSFLNPNPRTRLLTGFGTVPVG